MVLFLDLFGALLISGLINQQDEDNSLGPLSTPLFSNSKSFKYYSNRKGSQVVEVDWKNQCHVFDNGHAEWFRKTRAGQVTTLNYIQFQILLQKCDLDSNSGSNLGRAEGGFTEEHHLNENTIMNMWNDTRFPNILIPGGESDFGNHSQFHQLFNDSDVSLFMDYADNSSTTSGPPLIFPGTKWCGRGDIASSSDDLGIYEGTDRCCREHDHCPENIAARTTKYGLKNDGDYTRSHCKCDQTFLTCLEKDRSLSSLTSFKIANIYFNLLKPQCFDRRHPTVACRERRLSGDCIAFQYDFQQPATYQFFPAQPYILRQARKLFNAILYGNKDFSRPIPTSLPLPNSEFINEAISNFPKPPFITDNALGKTR